MFRWLALASVIVALLTPARESLAVASELPSSASSDQQRAPEFEPGEVLVRWRDGVSKLLLRAIDGSPAEEISDGVTLVRVPTGTEMATVEFLSSRDEVVWAQPNYVRQSQVFPNDPIYTQQWGMAKIQAPQAWDITTGSPSIIVAIVDTGVDLSHPDLQGRILEGKNFLDPDQPPQDDGGHGTHVAGTLAAAMNNNTGIAGIASGVSILPVKVLRANGSGKDSTVAMGIRWAIDRGARVINMSFSGADVSPILTEAVAYAQSRNVIMVVAAGNDGSAAPTFPAATSPVIAVAASDQNDRRAPYSNYGDWIDIAAPGTGVWSTYWNGGSTYKADTGTSMAAPHVSGVIALILSLRPELGPSEVENILRTTADPVSDAGMGAGRLNAARAVAAAAARPQATGTAVLPGPTPAAVIQPTAVSGGASLAAASRARAYTYNAPAPATTIYLPALVRSGDGWNTRVNMMNTTAATASISVRLLDPGGSSPASLQATLPGYGATALELSPLQFLPAVWEGSAVVTADNPIAVIVTMTRATGNSIAYDGRSAGSPVAYAPLIFKNRNGWNTSIFVQNLGTESTAVQLVYTSASQAGSWSETTAVPAMASRRVNQADTPGLPGDFVGSVTVNSLLGAPITLVVMETSTSGNAAAYTVPLTVGTTLVAPVVFKNRTTNGVWNTGIQVQNLGGEVAQLSVAYRPSEGPGSVVIDRATIPPGASRTFYQPTTESLSNGFVGSATVVVENGQLLAGLVNEVNYDRNVSAIYQLLGGGQTTIYAPLLTRNVDGISTGLQVQNLGQRPAQVTLTFRNQAGATLAVQTDTIDPSSARSYFQPAIAGLPDGFVGTAALTSDNGQPLAAIVNAVGY